MSSSKNHRASEDEGETTYSCPNCLRIELNSYEGWLWHLGSREHQDANAQRDAEKGESFFNPKGPDRPEILRRCVDVHGILGLKARQLLDYFKTWGEIQDFSYWYKKGGLDGLAVRCICLYKDKDSAEACIDEQVHELDGKKLKVEAYKTHAHRGGQRSSGGGESRKRRGDGFGDYEWRGYKSSRY